MKRKPGWIILAAILAAWLLVTGSAATPAPAAPPPVPAAPSAAGAALSYLYLPVVLQNATPQPPTPPPPAGLKLTPFNADANDLGGPGYWNNRYGKTPEIVVASNGTSLDVLANDYDDASAWKAVLLHIEPSGSDYQVTQQLTDMPFIDKVMGLASDAAGNRYYATAVNEDDLVTNSYPPANTYRSNIVRVVKLDPAGGVLFNIDLDIARHDFDTDAEMIINPMVAGSARLAVGGGQIGLVHSINMQVIEGVRHQKNLSTWLDANSGAVTSTGSIWVSHSFDQRLLYDGTGLIELHLGDAYPRQIIFNRKSDGKGTPLFYIKGPTGENETRTRLGNLALIENDASYGLLGLFSSESTATTSSAPINGPRNLGIVRVSKDLTSLDPALPDTLTVTSGGTERTNHLRWITSYTAASNLHAERPKLIGLGGDQYVVLWEQWTGDTSYIGGTYSGLYAMLIDAQGNTLLPAKQLTTTHHLPRGDDAFLLAGKAAWMTGSDSAKQLYIHFVDAALNYSMVTVK